MGASNHTYNTFPSASFNGTGMPQSRSLVTALGCKPASSQLLHCPSTFGFQSAAWSFNIHSRNHSSCLFNGRNQCFVSFFTGDLPLNVLRGLINWSGLSELPHFSHWSPNALSCPHTGQVPTIYRSAKKVFASSSKYCSVSCSSRSPLLFRKVKNSCAVS